MSEQISSLQISELVCTRISHDLVGNIGAVSNAVELLDDDPDCVAEVKPILEFSSKVLSARLKFFRLAFGLDNAAIRNIPELEAIANAYIQTIGNKNYPITLNLNISTVALYKIVLLGIMSMADVFIKGGTISINEDDSGLTFDVKSDAHLCAQKLVAQQQTLQKIIPDENPALMAPVAYLRFMLESSHVTLNLDFNETSARLHIG